jgi:hypothetical protein
MNSKLLLQTKTETLNNKRTIAEKQMYMYSLVKLQITIGLTKIPQSYWYMVLLTGGFTGRIIRGFRATTFADYAYTAY